MRKLIAVVRNTSGRAGPIYSRKVLTKNLLVSCVCHTLLTSSFLPFLALQGSVSIWITPLPDQRFPITINIGSTLLMILHITAAFSVILGPSFVQKLGNICTMTLGCVVFAIFYALHLYPIFYVLIPGYILLGIVLGPISIARITFLMTLSSKLSYIFSEDDEETKFLRRTCIVRRISRAFQAAHDVGFILGSILSAVVITYSFNISASINRTILIENINETKADLFQLSNNNNITNCTLDFEKTNCTKSLDNFQTTTLDEYNNYLDEIFDVDEIGDRLCGAQACPSNYQLTRRNSTTRDFFILPKDTAIILVSLYIFLSLMAVVVSVLGLDKIKMYVRQDPLERSEGSAALKAVRDSFKDVKLQLAAPLAFFIGLEQSFMYADFSKVMWSSED